MMSVEDVGPVIVNILRNRSIFLGKTESICGDKITVREMAEVLSRYLRPKFFRDKQVGLMIEVETSAKLGSALLD